MRSRSIFRTPVDQCQTRRSLCSRAIRVFTRTVSSLFLQSKLLPFRHGFSVRQGGVSEGPYASLNLGFSVGDARERVQENLRRFTAEIGITPSHLRAVSQVHGDRVLEATSPGESNLPEVVGEADALWTKVSGLAVGVKTADCVPILLVDPDSSRVAAVHSGWRGTDLRIAAKAVETLAKQGSAPARLLAAVGPCIQKCCYEVSGELAHRFRASFGGKVVSEHNHHPHLDLSAAVRQTLIDAGLSPDRVDVLPHCTSCDAARFFSHRRDRGVSGRHLSFVVAP